MNNTSYLGLSVLETCRMVLCDLWLMITLRQNIKKEDDDSFMVYIKRKDIYVDVEKRDLILQFLKWN